MVGMLLQFVHNAFDSSSPIKFSDSHLPKRVSKELVLKLYSVFSSNSLHLSLYGFCSLIRE